MELVSLLIFVFAVGFFLGNLLRGISEKKKLPTWKKSEKLIEGALLDRGILYIPRYMIELSELKKLPKEE